MDFIMNAVAWTVAHSNDLLAVAGAVVVPASLIANFTPTETDNKVVNIFGGVVNKLALYFHNPDSKSVSKTPEVK